MRTLSATVSRVARSVSATPSANTTFWRQRASCPDASHSVCDAVMPTFSLSQLENDGSVAIDIAAAPPVLAPLKTACVHGIDRFHVLLVPRM